MAARLRRNFKSKTRTRIIDCSCPFDSEGRKRVCRAMMRTSESGHQELSRRGELRQLLAGVEHAGLHGGFIEADNLRDVLDRLAMEIHEIDDLPVHRRQARHGAAENLVAILLLAAA